MVTASTIPTIAPVESPPFVAVRSIFTPFASSFACVSASSSSGSSGAAGSGSFLPGAAALAGAAGSGFLAGAAGSAFLAGAAGSGFLAGAAGLAGSAGLSDLSSGQMSLHFPYFPLPFTKVPVASTSVGHHGSSLFPVSPIVVH